MRDNQWDSPKQYLRIICAAEEDQVVLVDVLGDVQAVCLNQFLVVGKLLLIYENIEQQALGSMWVLYNGDECGVIYSQCWSDEPSRCPLDCWSTQWAEDKEQIRY